MDWLRKFFCEPNSRSPITIGINPDFHMLTNLKFKNMNYTACQAYVHMWIENKNKVCKDYNKTIENIQNPDEIAHSILRVDDLCRLSENVLVQENIKRKIHLAVEFLIREEFIIPLQKDKLKSKQPHLWGFEKVKNNKSSEKFNFSQHVLIPTNEDDVDSSTSELKTPSSAAQMSAQKSPRGRSERIDLTKFKNSVSVPLTRLREKKGRIANGDANSKGGSAPTESDGNTMLSKDYHRVVIPTSVLDKIIFDSNNIPTLMARAILNFFYQDKSDEWFLDATLGTPGQRKSNHLIYEDREAVRAYLYKRFPDTPRETIASALRGYSSSKKNECKKKQLRKRNRRLNMVDTPRTSRLTNENPRFHIRREHYTD